MSEYNENDYKAEAEALLYKLYEVCSDAHAMIERLNEAKRLKDVPAATAEWQMLYAVQRNANVAADMLHANLYPRGSAFPKPEAHTPPF